MNAIQSTDGLASLFGHERARRMGPRYAWCACGVQIDATRASCYVCRASTSRRAGIQDSIVAVLRELGPLTAPQITEAIAARERSDQTSVHYSLAKLRKRGLITKSDRRIHFRGKRLAVYEVK